MIQNDKLVQFYFSQYKESARKSKRSSSGGKSNYAERISRLLKQLKSTPASVNPARLEDYHRQIRNLSYSAFRQKNEISIMQIRDMLLPQLLRLDLAALRSEERELIDHKFLDYLRAERNGQICKRTLASLYKEYSEGDIKNQIITLVPSKPEMEFAQTRQMERHFILHIGPTNCGKTYHALERLKEAESGVYLGPLRLLALEVYEKMNDMQIPCTMLTGEECIYEENSRITSSTIEMLDFDNSYDVAVIDEAQMIMDSDRGHSWTRAILGVLAKEIHVCMSPAAEQVVTHLISLCGDTFEIRRYERMTRLLCEEEPFVFPDDVQEGDALILFTKRAVLDTAGRLEREGIRASVIYGSLPPEIRRRQIRLFTSHETKVVVSTDAIGMGLNLPVRRIVFVQTEKFDGKTKRPLQIPEVKQIAGRAGRFGIYDTGYVNALGDEALAYIRNTYMAKEEPIDTVSLGFPRVLLDMPDPLNAVLKIWKSVEPTAPFEKISIDDILFLYERAYKAREEIDGFEDKHTLYRMLTCSIDIKNKDIVDLWLYYCKTYSADTSLHFPALSMCTDKGLQRYETYYKMLDLYHQFSTRLGKLTDIPRLDTARERTEDNIMHFLLKDKKDYIRKCKYCGRTLPIGYGYTVCDRCHDDRQIHRIGYGGRHPKAHRA